MYNNQYVEVKQYKEKKNEKPANDKLFFFVTNFQKTNITERHIGENKNTTNK